jgi:hypothetical protein
MSVVAGTGLRDSARTSTSIPKRPVPCAKVSITFSVPPVPSAMEVLKKWRTRKATQVLVAGNNNFMFLDIIFSLLGTADENLSVLRGTGPAL